MEGRSSALVDSERFARLLRTRQTSAAFLSCRVVCGTAAMVASASSSQNSKWCVLTFECRVQNPKLRGVRLPLVLMCFGELSSVVKLVGELA